MWEEVFSLEVSTLFTYVPVAPKKKEDQRAHSFIILLEGNDDSLPYNKEASCVYWHALHC